MSRKHWSDVLESVGPRRERACQEAIDWARTQRSPAAAWKRGIRADWMLWALERAPEPDTQRLTLVACEIAREVLHLVPAGEERPRLAIEAAEAWAAEPSEAARAAASTAGCAAWAAWAAYAPAWAARAAAWATGEAARAASEAASAAASAAAEVAGEAARDAALKDYCVIIRRHFPKAPKLEEVRA